MDRRWALAATAAVGLSITGLAVAVGATTQVFTAADASPNVGRVSPVSRPVDPDVETHVVDVVDPAPPAATAPAATPAPTARPTGTFAASALAPVTAPAPAAVAAPAPTAASLPHEVEHERADD